MTRRFIGYRRCSEIVSKNEDLLHLVDRAQQASTLAVCDDGYAAHASLSRKVALWERVRKRVVAVVALRGLLAVAESDDDEIVRAAETLLRIAAHAASQSGPYSLEVSLAFYYHADAILHYALRNGRLDPEHRRRLSASLGPFTHLGDNAALGASRFGREAEEIARSIDLWKDPAGFAYHALPSILFDDEEDLRLEDIEDFVEMLEDIPQTHEAQMASVREGYRAIADAWGDLMAFHELKIWDIDNPGNILSIWYINIGANRTPRAVRRAALLQSMLTPSGSSSIEPDRPDANAATAYLAAVAKIPRAASEQLMVLGNQILSEDTDGTSEQRRNPAPS